jgi:hypothetical protein
MSNPSAVVDKLRRSFVAGKSLPIDYRKAQLKNLLRLYDEGENEVRTTHLYQIIKCRPWVPQIARQFFSRLRQKLSRFS